MSGSRCDSDAREVFSQAILEGLTIEEASMRMDVQPATIKGWITKGRKEDSGPYREFVDAYEEAKGEKDAFESAVTYEELRAEVWRACRKGSVRAMKLMWDMLDAEEQSAPDPNDPFADLGDPVDNAGSVALKEKVRHYGR